MTEEVMPVSDSRDIECRHSGRDEYDWFESRHVENIKVVQGVISRLADNSAKCKNWMLVVSGAAVSLFSSGVIASQLLFIGAYALIVLAFWFMDAKYLQTERLFRTLHRHIVSGSAPYLFTWELDVSGYKKDCLLKVMFSWSMLVYHVAFLLSLIAISIQLAK